ncbi:MAG: ParB/RepB/Spo0J family partition protein [Treponema sp.]|nr:ParB/RepB/Spo0J family partition protein [Treponema sp.]
METIKVPIGKIISSIDRKYGGEGNIETLAQSISEHGLIHPLSVKECADKKGYYKVIAGRRRFAAVQSLGWKSVPVHVHDENTNDEYIALAENVNREDMHPLDEAEAFKRRQDQGMDIEEIAKYYSRSTKGILQRIRLTSLIDGIKTMFRDGKLNISAAALIASLPVEDQEKFLKKYSDKTVDKWEIGNFMRSVQKHTIKHIADKKCAKCKERTYNTTPGLFDGEFSSLEDICFNGECYAKKWQALIGKMIAEQTGETENNIILNRGLPEFLSKKEKTLTIGEIEYTLLPNNAHNWKVTTKKGKSKTAWLVSLDWCMNSGADKIKVERVTFEKQERQASYTSSYQSRSEDPIKDFMLDHISGINEEDRKYIAEQLKKKYHSSWSLRNEVKSSILNSLIIERLKEEPNEESPNDSSFFHLFFLNEISGDDDNGNYQEIDPDYQEYFTAAFGENVKPTDIHVGPTVEKVFKFILATNLQTNEMPDLNDSEDEWQRAEASMFWKFMQMSREFYTELYKTTLDVIVSKVIQATPESETSETLDENDSEDDTDIADDFSDEDHGDE